MSDTIDDFRFLKLVREMRRRMFGVPCPRCSQEQPRRQPTILLPGHSCRVHRPLYVDPRPELSDAQEQALFDAVQAETAI